MRPCVRLFVVTEDGEQELDDGFAGAPLPGGELTGSPTYGSYFSWLENCLVEKNLDGLARAASRLPGGPGDFRYVTAVEIVAEKHGAWYHPARVRVFAGKSHATLCANAALFGQAAEQARFEHEILKKMNASRAQRLVPESFGVFREPFLGNDAAVLLCEYFPGFYEFHLREQAIGPPRLFLWDTDQGPRKLSVDEANAVYFEAARILCYYYDPETFNEIHPWHHAAGDFVFCPGTGDAGLRLVTVRGFSPVFDPPEGSGDAGTLLGLFLFLISVSLRTRVDRDNGTGKLLAAGEDCVLPTVRGFFAGLSEACAERGLSDLPPAFGRFLGALGKNELIGTCEAVASSVRPEAFDAGVLAGLVATHSQSLAAALSDTVAKAFWG